MKKLMLTALSAAALGLGALPAVAAPIVFTVDESPVVPGVPDTGTFTAEKLNGGYTEVLTIGAPNMSGISNFSTHAVADFGQFEGGTSLGKSFLIGSSGIVLEPLYAMYAVFTSSGTFDNTTGTFTGNLGAFELFIDPNQDTTKTLGATGSDTPTIGGGTMDDFRIASSATLLAALGQVVPGTGGFFDLTFGNVLLDDPNGMLFFPSLNGISFRTVIDGDFDQIIVAGNQTISGDVSAVFESVPEPSGLALVGLALAGLAGVSRKQPKQS